MFNVGTPISSLMGWNGMQWPTCQETSPKHRLLISSPCQNLVGSKHWWTRPCLKSGRFLSHGLGWNWRLCCQGPTIPFNSVDLYPKSNSQPVNYNPTKWYDFFPI